MAGKKNVCCHLCRISENRVHKKPKIYTRCGNCPKSYCSRCISQKGFDEKQIAKGKCPVCIEDCCCNFVVCNQDHGPKDHCFTYKRTVQRHQVELKWVKRKKEDERKKSASPQNKQQRKVKSESSSSSRDEPEESASSASSSSSSSVSHSSSDDEPVKKCRRASVNYQEESENEQSDSSDDDPDWENSTTNKPKKKFNNKASFRKKRENRGKIVIDAEPRAPLAEDLPLLELCDCADAYKWQPQASGDFVQPEIEPVLLTRGDTDLGIASIVKAGNSNQYVNLNYLEAPVTASVIATAAEPVAALVVAPVGEPELPEHHYILFDRWLVKPGENFSKAGIYPGYLGRFFNASYPSIR